MNKHERIEWCDIWVAGADTDTPPKVLLVGDSISRSYFAQVEEALAGKFLCARLATSTCICAPAFQKELSPVLDEYRFALIHFNNGLHGWDYDEDAYAKSFPRALDFIARRGRGSKLIWASSTPVRRRGALNEFDARTERARERNRIAAGHAASRGIPVNDLFARVESHPEYYSEDGCHFNPAGVAVLGNQVAQCILANA
jgi:hypothetical protein